MGSFIRSMKIQKTEFDTDSTGALTKKFDLKMMCFFGKINRGLLTATALILGAAWTLSGAAYAPQGAEFPIIRPSVGDQVFPDLAVNQAGGYIVWQDNASDGSGLGVSAQRLDRNYSRVLSPFRISELTEGDQESVRIAQTSDGGAVFVWQGGTFGFQKVYIRFIAEDGTFKTGDIAVSNSSNLQRHPVVAVLKDGSVLVVWEAFAEVGSDAHLRDIYAKKFNGDGTEAGDEFRVNQFSRNNQRSPSVAATSNGGAVVAWVSELQTGALSVDIFARFIGSDTQAQGDEFPVSSGQYITANPDVDVTSSGDIIFAWGELVAPVGNVVNDLDLGWEVFSRKYNAEGLEVSGSASVNNFHDGDQYAPRITTFGNDYLIVWTSGSLAGQLTQDGSREGVFGQFIGKEGIAIDGEFQINTTVPSRQIHAVVDASGSGNIVVAWSGFQAGTSFDLAAQRFTTSEGLPQPSAPFVSALNQFRISITWDPMTEFDVASFELYVDSEVSPRVTEGNSFLHSPLAPGSAHSYRLAYVLSNGRRSPLSNASEGSSWAEDLNGDGLPDDWEETFWGSAQSDWPRSFADSDSDGATNFQEYLAGTHPLDSESVLKTDLQLTDQGWLLSWNTQSGLIYQVQASDDLENWQDLDEPRFAPDGTDSMLLNTQSEVTYYRIVRIR